MTSFGKIDNYLDRHRELMQESWDRHAEDNAMFFINTLGKSQHDPFQWNEAEFYASGADVLQFVHSYFPDSLDHKVLLEIGCGIGRQTLHLSPLFKHVFAADIAPKMLEIAGSKLAHLTNVSWTNISGSDLEPVPTASCDVVYSFIVFQHITDVRITARLIQEASRVMKEGARFVFQVRDLEKNRETADVWQMTDLSATTIHEICDQCRLNVDTIHDEDTHYLWAICSKI